MSLKKAVAVYEGKFKQIQSGDVIDNTFNPIEKTYANHNDVISNMDFVIVNTTGGAFTLKLPASPVIGYQVKLVDGAGYCSTNNLTIDRNSNKITGVEENLLMNLDNVHVILTYYNSTYGWSCTIC